MIKPVGRLENYGTDLERLYVEAYAALRESCFVHTIFAQADGSVIHHLAIEAVRVDEEAAAA